MSLSVTNIQRFSLHDGPGIRTTVFLRGCAARCPWCANPENLDFGESVSFDKKKCVRVGDSCFLNANCPILSDNQALLDRECAERCKAGALSVLGDEVTAAALLEELLKDREYYGEEGGVTFSGGEALLQAENLIEVFESLKALGISVAVETSLFVPFENVKIALPYIDFFYVDVKDLTEDAPEKVGIKPNVYLKNLEYVTARVNMDRFVWRFPVVKDYTDTKENIAEIRAVAQRLGIKKMEIFSVHNLGEAKYQSVGKKATHFDPIGEDRLLAIKETLQFKQLEVKIIRI